MQAVKRGTHILLIWIKLNGQTAHIHDLHILKPVLHA